MSDQPSARDFPNALVIHRLNYLAHALTTDPAFSKVVLNRLMYLVTRHEDDFDQDKFEALVSQYRSTELDIAILRAVADAIEASEPKQLDALSKGDPS